MGNRLTAQEVADIEAATAAIIEVEGDGVTVRLHGRHDGTVILRRNTRSADATRRALRRINPHIAITRAPRI